MFSRKMRVRTAAVTAGLAMLAVAGSAGAATVGGSSSYTVKHNVAITKGTFNVTSLAKSVKGPTVVTPIARGGEIVVFFDAGSTGDGPFSDDTCRSGAQLMNEFAELAHESWLSGNQEGAVEADNEVQEIEEDLLNGGCFIVYRQGPPPEPEPEIG